MSDLSEPRTLDTHGESRWSLADGAVLGGYRVLRPLGRGGMGEVYLTENVLTGKRFALKLLPADLARDPGFRGRFAREAAVLQELRHDGIVMVHHAAEEDGRFFLTMDYVEGGSLEDRLRGGDTLRSERGHAAGAERRAPASGEPVAASSAGAAGRSVSPEARVAPDRLTEAETARVALELCEALSYAHGRGVLHMDLKPGNVLLGRDGRAKLSDFGLAKLLGTGAGPGARASADGRELSLAETRADPDAPGARRRGAGTPGYMSPEQEGGEPLDERSDIFALGVVIYCMLMGRRPVALPRMPSEAGLARAWDGIIRGCLADDPDDRFGSARELAERLRSPGSPADAGAPGGGPREDARPAAAPDLFEFPPLPRGRGAEGGRVPAAPPPLPPRLHDRERPGAPAPPRRRRGGLARFARVAVLLGAAAVAAALLLRGPSCQTLRAHKATVTSVAFPPGRGGAPDGRLLVTGSADGTIAVWKEAPPSGSPGSRGRAGPGAAAAPPWILETQLLSGEGGVTSLAFSPDGRALLAGNEYHTATLWDVASGTEIAALKGHEGAVVDVAFSPGVEGPAGRGTGRGGRLVTVSADGTIALWSAATGEELAAAKSPGTPTCAAFSPDGAGFVVGHTGIGLLGGKGSATVHDAATGEVGATLGLENRDWVLALAFSPDGKYLAAAETDAGLIRKEHFVRLYDVASGKLLRRFGRHGERVNGVAFSPDGRYVATASDDGTAAVWEASTGELALKLGGLASGHRDAVKAVAFSPDGRLLVTASADRTARVWLLPESLRPAAEAKVRVHASGPE